MLIKVDISIVVEYGSPVPDVAHSIQENVKKAVETMSGLDVHTVDVHVTGISFEREMRAAAELEEQRRKMLEQSETVEEENEAEAVQEEVQAEVEQEADDSAEMPEIEAE